MTIQRRDFPPTNGSPSAYGTVNPVERVSDIQHADAQFSKGARRGGVWRVLFFIALLVLVGALSAIGYIAFTYWNGQHAYDELAEHMQVDDPDTSGLYTLGSFDVDWDALRAINPDVVGWVYVPDTVINYPIAWRDHDDAYYLTHNFGNTSVGAFGAEYGCVMLSGVNSPEWTDQVNIIYGHNMRNGSMFALLAKFMADAEFNAHRTFYVLTPVGNFRMTSFACDKVPGNSTSIVIPNFQTKEELQAYVQARIDESGVVPNPAAPPASQIQQVFAFSTCSYPDDQYRIITFCTVDEFLPAGSDVTEGNALIAKEDVENVESLMGQRLS